MLLIISYEKKENISKRQINIYITFFYLFTESCTSSSSVGVGKIKSYMFMQLLVAILYFVSYASILNVFSLYRGISYNELVNPWGWFYWCRKILTCLVISSLSNQLGSILMCRPIDILYDIRYISMIIVQIMGFFISLFFAFFLGVKYASIRWRKLIKSLSKIWTIFSSMICCSCSDVCTMISNHFGKEWHLLKIFYLFQIVKKHIKNNLLMSNKTNYWIRKCIIMSKHKCHCSKNESCSDGTDGSYIIFLLFLHYGR